MHTIQTSGIINNYTGLKFKQLHRFPSFALSLVLIILGFVFIFTLFSLFLFFFFFSTPSISTPHFFRSLSEPLISLFVVAGAQLNLSFPIHTSPPFFLFL
jgi:hypothetical protein